MQEAFGNRFEGFR